MWQTYENSVREQAPQAEILLDKFQLAKHLNEPVNKVRRAEQKQLTGQGRERLADEKKGSLSS